MFNLIKNPQKFPRTKNTFKSAYGSENLDFKVMTAQM